MTREPPKAYWPDEYQPGAPIGLEYGLIFQLLREGQPFVNTCHNVNIRNLQEAADYFGMPVRFTDIGDGQSSMEAFR